MYVLGIETSCDETAAAVVGDGKFILSNIVASSLKFHKLYGGIVPEIAFRMHLETITQVVERAVKEAGLEKKKVGLISVTSTPGLLGSLLVGVSFAKALALSMRIPFQEVDHLEGHIYASFLQEAFSAGARQGSDTRAFPFVALVVSGGHTSLFFVEDIDRVNLLGSTQDDACGEAFDKVAKILGMGYPGGPLIEAVSRKADKHRLIKFSCSHTRRHLDFSFSGIKTAVLYYTQKKQKSADLRVEDIAASFQEAAINALVEKTFLACKLKQVKRLIVGGGVAANSRLRERFFQAAGADGISISFPSKRLCMDNAAMIAGLGWSLFKKRQAS
ncbi:MAG: tRNA (adenosine(37)-N6)-threonylcarbamoyltransferase complex transferase subunit TsaD [Candidatus Omnitrophota bacterium]